MSDERVPVAVEDAMARLKVIPDYDCGCPGDPGPHVHTYLQTGFALLGAHWPITDVRKAIEAHGVEESGPQATSAGHGLVIAEGHPQAPVFLETLP